MDWKTSGRVKIERAREHIIKIETEIKAFLEAGPYSLIRQNDEATGDRLTSVRINRLPPARLSAIAGDATHNLRSALNCLWNCAVNGDGTNRIGGEDFPIKKNLDLFDKTKNALLSRREELARMKTIVGLLDEIKPYQSGNKLLWMLHQSNNEDKHGGSAPIFVKLTAIDVRYTPEYVARMKKRNEVFGVAEGMTELGREWFRNTLPYEEYGAVQDGAVLMREPAARVREMKMDIQPILDVAFGESRVIKGRPILATLGNFSEEVESIAKRFGIAGLITD